MAAYFGLVLGFLFLGYYIMGLIYLSRLFIPLTIILILPLTWLFSVITIDLLILLGIILAIWFFIIDKRLYKGDK